MSHPPNVSSRSLGRRPWCGTRAALSHKNLGSTEHRSYLAGDRGDAICPTGEARHCARPPTFLSLARTCSRLLAPTAANGTSNRLGGLVSRPRLMLVTASFQVGGTQRGHFGSAGPPEQTMTAASLRVRAFEIRDTGCPTRSKNLPPAFCSAPSPACPAAKPAFVLNGNQGWTALTSARLPSALARSR